MVVMVAKFSINNWRDIMRICGSLCSPSLPDDDPARYLDFDFDYTGFCFVCATNGEQAARIRVNFAGNMEPDHMHILIEPVRPTSHTKSVEIHIEDNGDYTIIFLDDEGEILDGSSHRCPNLRPIDYGAMFSDVQNSFNRLSGPGYGLYFITVNPKLLIRALEGMKNCEKVTINFGKPWQPFSIHPADNSMEAQALVCPIRMI